MKKKNILLVKFISLFSFIIFFTCFFPQKTNAQTPSGQIIVRAIRPNNTEEYEIVNTSSEAAVFSVILGDGYIDVDPFKLQPGERVWKDGRFKPNQLGNYPVQLKLMRETTDFTGTSYSPIGTIGKATLVVADDPTGIPASTSEALSIGATRPETCGSDDVIKTALGCIPTKPQDLIGKLLTWGISLAGGIAFLFMLWAGFQYITSTGNPEKLQEASQILTSAIAGLILIIFSVFLLRLIGVTVLKIPGFK